MSIKNTDMRKFFNLIIAIGISGSLSAQFVNNGATIVVQSGATLRIETNLINNAGSTITNNGTIEVKGDFTNAATFNSPTGSTVKFIDTGNSTVTSGGAELRNVTIEKTTGANVILAGNLTVAGALNFAGANNRVVLGANNLTIKTGGTVTGVSANEYVNASAAGKLIKGVGGSSTVNMEVGDATNYTPISNVITGSGYTSASVSARVIDLTHPSKPTEADSYLTRYWEISSSGISAYNNTMTATYAPTGDVVGTKLRVKGASYASPNWSFNNALNNNSTTISGSTNLSNVDFTGINALNKVDIQAYLSAALVGSSMTNVLQVYDPPTTPTLLPTLSPYGAPTSSYTDIENDMGVAGMLSDWVKVEVRDAVDPSILLETRSLLLKTNGHIVDTNGSIPYFKDHTSNVRYALHHRNHLAVLSNSNVGVFEGITETYNFSSAQTQAVKLDSGDPDQLQLKNGLYCMRPGDVNSTLEVDGSDLILVRVQFLNGAGSIYINQDVNLDGEVDGSDLILTRISFLNSLFSTLANL